MKTSNKKKRFSAFSKTSMVKNLTVVSSNKHYFKYAVYRYLN